MLSPTITVLLIGDDKDDYLLTREILSEIGEESFELRWAAGYEAGLEALKDDAIDVCLIDYRIGDHSGLEIVVAYSSQVRRIPMILLAGQADYQLDLAATEAGAADFLEKSALTPRLLGRSIRYAIRRQKDINVLEATKASLTRTKAELETVCQIRTRELRDATARLTDAVENISEGFALWDDQDRLIMCNSRYRKVYREVADLLDSGLAFEDFLRACYDRGVFPLVGRDIEGALKKHQSRHRTSVSAYEQQLGNGRWVRISKRRTEAGHIVGIVSDVTERKEAEAKIKQMESEDGLTRLPNRAFFQSSLESAIANARRTGRVTALLLLDLDHFKEVNDNLGHQSGDQLLQQVSRRIYNCARVTDTVARLGGDEFAIVATNIRTDDGVTVLAERIIDALSKPFACGGHDVRIGVSIGISVFPQDADQPDILMRTADLALYKAKETDRGSYQLYNEQIDAEIKARRAMEDDLRKALDRGEFHLVYQPQFDLHSGAVVGAEALIRWRHPEHGPVSPGAFIPRAEATGLIVPISDWVLRTSCGQLRQWHNRGLSWFGLSINISPIQFKQRDLVPQIREVLKDTGLDPCALELEITEGVAMDAGDEVIDTLLLLKELGIGLAIDDFGTGFSSLNRLKRFPIDRLKIDQSFVRDITKDPNDAAISATVIQLGHGLNIKVIAEGVETREQLDFLWSQGCDEVQGYYFSKPLPPEEFESFLEQHNSSALVANLNGGSTAATG